MESLEIAKLAADALDSKKGEDISILDISEISDIADYFVIATGKNTNQMEALMDAADEALAKAGINLRNTEGNKESSWILMDYSDVIVHIFDAESRSFYDLDRIWKDSKKVI